jgi:putative ubiquitin-RnfH superfamily antitoxin RatB of RatAB toxin-antitoxin module
MIVSAKSLHVSVVFALPDGASIIELEVAEDATVADAIAQAGVLERHRDVDLGALACGIWGKIAGRDSRLADGDRIELYRPLLANPKQARRERARGTR